MLLRIESICSRNPNLSSAFAMFARCVLLDHPRIISLARENGSCW